MAALAAAGRWRVPLLALALAFGLSPIRPVHTYSIVARDPASGELGVAVQSHWFSVGSVVPWAEAGVGAVATQSIVDPSYGALGLALMRAGRSASEALAALVAGDPGREVRQVGMVDAQGRVATHVVHPRIVLPVLHPQARDGGAAALGVRLVPDGDVALDKLVQVAHRFLRRSRVRGILRCREAMRDYLRGRGSLIPPPA